MRELAGCGEGGDWCECKCAGRIAVVVEEVVLKDDLSSGTHDRVSR